jgi:hypothetical protein
MSEEYFETAVTSNPQRCQSIEVIHAVCPKDKSPVDSSFIADGIHLNPLGYE